MSGKIEVYTGKWGYYSCSKAHFLEVKEHHKKCLNLLREVMCFYRERRKLPKNRKLGLKPPKLDIQTLDDCLNYKKEYQEVLAYYQVLRHPKQKPEEVIHLPKPKGLKRRF